MLFQLRSMKDRTIGLMIAVALVWPAAVCFSDHIGPIGPHACCDDAGAGICEQRTAVQACGPGWVDQGNGTGCGDIQACFLAGDNCIDIDVLCCDDVGGTAGGSGSVCPDRSCCFASGGCLDLPPTVCNTAGGTSGAFGSACSGDVQACCLSVTECGTDEDCCLNADTVCCGTTIEGLSIGTNSSCEEIALGGGDCKSTACCKSDHVDETETTPWCDDDEYYTCMIDESGVPDLSNTCAFLADMDGDNVADSCDNCEPGNPNHHCGFFDCGNLGQEDGDGDGVGDVCDNCTLTNALHDCGNPAIDCFNPGQEDADGDAIGDDCDNCPLFPNGPQLGTCLNARTTPATTCTSDADCDVDPGDGVCSNAQEDCALDAFPCDADPNVNDCDQDGIPDECDPDIDGDGVDNDEDICDFTPQGLTVETSGVFIGSVRADLDGDCDVDSYDRVLFDAKFDETMGASACSGHDGESNEDDLTCPACALCPPCNSCCLPCRFEF